MILTGSLEEYEYYLTQLKRMFDGNSKLNVNNKIITMPVIISGIMNAQKLGDSGLILEYAEYLEALSAKNGLTEVIQDDYQTMNGFLYNKRVEQYLHKAITEDLFEIYYQPVYSTRKKCFITLEALSRLQHPELGWIAPDVFIQIAEKNHMIEQITDLQFSRVCRFLGENRYLMRHLLNVKVNLSSLDLMRNDCSRHFIRIMDAYKIPHNWIQFEITETVATECNAGLRRVAEEFTDAGIGLCLDDFGSGYANLNTVMRLPFSVIKVDRSLLFDICRDGKRAIFYESVVETFHKMNYHIVSEGVETQEEMEQVSGQCDVQKNKLVDVRMNYLQNHPKRDFSASAENNDDYDSLLSELSCNELEEYQKKAAEQAKAAVEHFKEDFVYKIRSAIKEAYVRRDELNRIIRNLNFGKDRYQFKITRNKGADGAFYDMFMDEDLDIDPSSLASPMEHQMNLFSMEHENKYGMLMSDLIHIFIPPENATQQELDEAKQNMVKYADYRTYLSFEMEQIVEGDERLVIGLSKMIKKNSGGEGQNPLYIALLASFAQAYHINLSARLTRRPTIRLVVLDEAFSKMDAEKVASCIELIRGLGFQAIISATNDKIQNYIENVDKTFVYANPNKKSISIQEFEKKDFSQLVVEEE